MTARTLRLGTRASALATSQSSWVADQLRAAGQEVDLVLVTTEGDTNRRSLTEIGGTGVFASALREALLDRRIDLAVHSLKDLPTAPCPGLRVAAVPEREDPRDVLVARDGLTLRQLPAGAVIGTGSPRRKAQLALARPDLRVQDIRGNVDSRIAMVRDARLDAVVLARAGLARLGRLEDATEVLETTVMLPAAGQGALAVECREEDTALADLLKQVMDHETTRVTVTAERAALSALEAGCTAPVGVLGVVGESARAADGIPEEPPQRPTLTLHAFAALQTGPQRHVATGVSTAPVELGRAVAQHLLNRPDPTSPTSAATSPLSQPVSAGSYTPESDL